VKSAPTDYLNGIAAAYNEPLLLVQIELDAGTVYLSDRAYTDEDSNVYDARIMNTLSLSLKTRRERGGGVIGDITLMIGNLDDWFSTYKSVVWGNKRVTIYEHFSGLTPSDDLLLYTGKINSNFKVSDSMVELAVQEDSLPTVEIPTETVNLGDFPTAPEESVGRPVPIVYGNNTWNYCNITASLTSFDRQHSLIKGIDGGVIAGKRRIIVGDGPDSASIDNVWAYDPTLGRMVMVATHTFTTVNGIAVVEIDTDPDLYDYVFGDGSVSGESENPPYSTVNDPAYACDQSNSDSHYAQLYAEDIIPLASIQESKFTIDFATYETSVADGDISEIKVYARTSLSTVGSVYAGRDLTVDGASVEYKSALYYYPATTYSGGSATAAEVAQGVECKLNGVADVDPIGKHTGKIYEVYKKVKYKKGEPLDIYIEGSGREYGSWITGRTNHPDNALSGSTIENHAGIIESLLREDAGITPNTASFDTVATDLDADSIVGNLVIYEKTDLGEWINDLCKVNAISYTPDSTGVPKVARFETGGSSVKSFTTANIIKGSLQVFKIDMSEVFNRLSMDYFVNPTSGKLQENDIASDATSITNYGTLLKLIKNYSTKDATSAGNQNDLLLSMLKDHDLGVIFETNLQGTILERGDVIDVTHNAGGYNWTSQKFEVMEIMQRGRIVRIVGHEYV